VATSGGLKNAGGAFWTLLGLGILVVLLAAGWRVATGAELEARGQEWSLKVTEAADTLDQARQQLETELSRSKEDAAKREAYWAAQLAAAKAACPNAASLPAPAPPASPASGVAGTEKALANVARTTANARVVARDLSRFKAPGF
jgi:hypothetical protein